MSRSGLQVQRQTHQSRLLSQSRGGAEEAQTGCRLTGGQRVEEAAGLQEDRGWRRLQADRRTEGGGGCRPAGGQRVEEAAG